MASDEQKAHRPRQSGRSKEKKTKSKQDVKNNPKAFAFNSGVAAGRYARRTMDVEQKRLHVPLVDRSSTEKPPTVVAVVGAPKTGKTTLIKCLVKRYAKHSLTEVKGPITVVSGKKSRITFIECANDMNAMIDVAKVADLVLMTIDASFGFEMETFEFLNILQAHGFPRIMGVLTHLDSPKFSVRNGGTKKLRKIKKKLKHRFWTEIYQGAKLFYLSGLINGRYPNSEILNLSRFISVMKFRPLVWKNSHPYMLADRFEDLTSEEQVRLSQGKCDRTVSFYGYVRGTSLKVGSKVHLAGVGDLNVDSVTKCEDPCPMANSNPDKKAKRRLDDKQKLIYAPMSDVGGILYDNDAVYISVPGKYNKENQDSEQNTEGDKLVLNLQDADQTIGQTLEESEIQMFSSGKFMKAKDFQMPDESVEVDESGRTRRRAVFVDDGAESDGDDSESDVNEDNYDVEGQGVLNESGDEEEEDIAFADSDSDLCLSEDEENNESGLRWKEKLVERAAINFRRAKQVDLMDLIYKPLKEANNVANSSDEDNDEELFRRVEQSWKDQVKIVGDATKIDLFSLDSTLDLSDHSMMEQLKKRFITGENTEVYGSENEEEGDFEDLEKEDADESQLTDKEEVSEDELDEDEIKASELAKKKEELKKKFDEQYDGQDENTGETNLYDEAKARLDEQAGVNKQAFQEDDPELRATIAGFQPGEYVRILIKSVPCEFVENFDPDFPILLGGLKTAEENYGFIQARIKRHRWHKRILKSNDPLIFSIGWRRFQSLPIYSLNDGSRNRMLKYTPEHMHCLVTFYGPLTPPNTGFCCVQSVSDVKSNFRIAATGVILETDQNVQIVKKLKLTGYPFKVMKNTAFIKDMFSSALEVAKFEGASLRTVSGIRGQVKKAQKQPEGSFRATFEDKILMSDIVFLRCWYPLKPRKYCNPVSNLLISGEKKWKGMRLVRELRKENQVAIPQNPDSSYKTITDRPEERNFNPLKIPKKLIKELPFKTKPKLDTKRSKPTYLQKRAVILEADEKKLATLMHRINTIKNAKEKLRKEVTAKKKLERAKKLAKEQAIKDEKLRNVKKEAYRKLGKKEASEKRKVEMGDAAFSAKRARH